MIVTYYTVFYRFKGTKVWLPADRRSIPNSYESYPVLYEGRERADRFASDFEKAGDEKYEARVVEVTVTPPEG